MISIILSQCLSHPNRNIIEFTDGPEWSFQDVKIKSLQKAKILKNLNLKAGDSLIWDSENKSYTANGNVEFKNDRFVAYADKMIANYIEENNKEIKVLLVVIELLELKGRLNLKFPIESYITF